MNSQAFGIQRQKICHRWDAIGRWVGSSRGVGGGGHGMAWSLSQCSRPELGREPTLRRNDAGSFWGSADATWPRSERVVLTPICCWRLVMAGGQTGLFTLLANRLKDFREARALISGLVLIFFA